MKKWLIYPTLVVLLLFSLSASSVAPALAAAADSGYTFTLDGKPLTFTVQPRLAERNHDGSASNDCRSYGSANQLE